MIVTESILLKRWSINQNSDDHWEQIHFIRRVALGFCFFRLSLLPLSFELKIYVCFHAAYNVLPRLRERPIACYGNAIFFKIVTSPARGGGYTTFKNRDFVAKNLTSWISRNFFRDIFICRHRTTSSRMVRHLIFTARQRHTFKKIASQSKTKNHSCSRG